MASVDGSKSIHAASNEVFDHVCVPCNAGGNVKEAKKYCRNCSEYLCDPCSDYHRTLTFTKNHTIISTDKVSAGLSQHLTINCECNQNQDVEFYCEDHSGAICRQCQMFLHRKCETTPIQRRSSGYTVTKIDSILSKTKCLKDKYDQLKQNCIDDKKDLKDSKDECKKEIQAFRKELDDCIDKLEQEILAELDQLESKEQRRTDERIATISTSLQILNADYQLLHDAKKDGRKHVMFATDIQTWKRFRECQNRFTELEKETVKLSLTFEKNSKTYDVLLSQMNTQLGSIEMKKASTKRVPTVLLGRRIQSQREVNIRLEDDTRTPGITGFAIMPNGYVVIYDTENNTVKVLDTSLTPTDSLFLSLPWDVTCLDDNNAIVTMFGKKQLQYVQIFPQLKTGHVIQLDKYCFGVAVSTDNIYVSCHNNPGEGEVRVLDKQGNIRRRLGVTKTRSFAFSTPYYITINRAGNKVFISDSGKVTCMTVDGDDLFTYRGRDLIKPEGLYCDDNDNILVCDRDSNNVQIIDARGNKAGTIVSAEDGLRKPCAVTFLKRDNNLVVGCYKMNNIFLYTLMA